MFFPYNAFTLLYNSTSCFSLFFITCLFSLFKQYYFIFSLLPHHSTNFPIFNISCISFFSFFPFSIKVHRHNIWLVRSPKGPGNIWYYSGVRMVRANLYLHIILAFVWYVISLYLRMQFVVLMLWYAFYLHFTFFFTVSYLF